MDKKNLMPQVTQPVNRITIGQLPDVLAELSEEALQQQGEESASVLPSWLHRCGGVMCSYDGDDPE